MVLPWLLAAFLLPAQTDPSSVAAGELERIKRGLVEEPSGEWPAQAEALVDRWPTTEAAGRALVWLGELAYQANQFDLARERFSQVEKRFPKGEVASLAARGLGDVAFKQGHWREAIRAYEAGLAADPPPLLSDELRQKRQSASREQTRLELEWAAWLALVLFVLWFGPALMTIKPELPVETRMLLPVYAILIGVAWPRDPNVRMAILYLALGSLAIVSIAFGAWKATSRSRIVLNGVMLLVANLAVGYIALRRAGIVDMLFETFKFGTNMG